MRHIFSFVIYFIILGGLFSQEAKNESAVDPFSNELSLDPSDIKVGVLLQGQVKHCSIKLQNIAYVGTLSISKVSTSCYCVEPKMSQSILKPRESAELTFKLTAGNAAKIINELIVIEYTNLDTQDLRIIKIPVSGKVDSVVEVSPRRLEFEALTSKGEYQKKSLVAQVGSSNISWCKLSVESRPGNIFDANIIQKNGEYEIQIAPKSDDLKYGINKGWIVINCKNESNEIVFQDNIPLNINKESPIFSDPPSFYLDDLHVGFDKQLTINIIKKNPNAKFMVKNLNDIKASTDSNCSIQVESNNDMELLVKLTPISSGLLKANIIIPYESDHLGELSIPIIGIVKSN